MMGAYDDFLIRKSQTENEFGFTPVWRPDFLFDFQHALTDWALARGRAAVLADCGLGKTPIELVWAENVARHTNGRVIIVTPIAVGHQTVAEGVKFGVECTRESGRITVTNYERLHHFNPADFAGLALDESSILKSFDGRRRQEITEFMRKIPYRLLATATAAPNDYIELGTSSEALGCLGHMDMLMRFFKNDTNSIKPGMSRRFEKPGQMFGDAGKWRFKGHAEVPFWRWVCSWARAIRRPSDLGFDDAQFILPELIEREHLVETSKPADGMLFNLPAVGLKEQREERRRSIDERCRKVAELVDHDDAALVWCHLNDEGDRLAEIIPGAVQVSGDDSDAAKEEKFIGFTKGHIRVLVTKPKIGAWGLNFQHCAHVTFFPSHSFEQYYQGVRRCWRFGQKRPVRVDVVTTEGEQAVLKNLQRKAQNADRMFSSLVAQMNQAMHIARGSEFQTEEEIPAWL